MALGWSPWHSLLSWNGHLRPGTVRSTTKRHQGKEGNHYISTQHHGAPWHLSPKWVTWLLVSSRCLRRLSWWDFCSLPSPSLPVPNFPSACLTYPWDLDAVCWTLAPLGPRKLLLTLAVPSQISLKPLPHPLSRTRCNYQPSTSSGLTSTFPLLYHRGRGDCTLVPWS